MLWPAAWAVSNYILSESTLRNNLPSLSILELGTGTGLVSISIAMGGAKRVVATDYEPLALALTRYAADTINNSNSKIIETELLDMCALEQKLPISLPEGNTSKIDIVVAADIMYEPKTGIAMAHRAVEALRQNCRVIIGDSPGRVRQSGVCFLNLFPNHSCGSRERSYEDTSCLCEQYKMCSCLFVLSDFLRLLVSRF